MVNSLSKMYSFFSNGYKKMKEYNAKGVFAWIISVFLVMNFLSTSNADAFIDTQATFRQEDIILGVDGKDEGPNLFKSTGSASLAQANHFLLTMCQTCYNSNEDITKDTRINAINKQGIIEMVDSQTIAILKSTPSINIPVALSNQWVPGYKEANSGIYAATDGYSFLSEIGIDALWERTSLIAYVLFVIVLIVAGFMIMLRQKIGGQVAITVFNALPNVIMGLILVPFSFAIIGLILNISMIGTNVISGVLGVTEPIYISNPFSLIGELWFGGSIAETMWESGATATGTLVGGAGGLGAGIMTAIGASTAGAGVLAVLGGLSFGLILFFLVLAAIVAYASVRVYMTLLKAYLSIVLDVVMAPLMIAFGSFPGQESMRDNVFKRVLKNALVFPGVFLFLNLAGFILADNINISFPYGLASGSWSDGGTQAGFTGALLKSFLAIALFYMAAEVPSFLADMIPVDGGKGAEAAIAGARKAASKIPIVGSFIGG